MIREQAQALLDPTPGMRTEKGQIADVTSHPNDTQYCPLLAPLNQTSQEVTHPGTTLVEARLTAEF